MKQGTTTNIPPMPRGEVICRFAKWCVATGRDISATTRIASNDRTSVPASLHTNELRDLLGFVELTGTADVFMRSLNAVTVG